MTDDVVAELDRWLEQWDNGYFVAAPSLETIPLVQSARDEIVALRQAMTHDSGAIATLCNHARAEALEEAARVADGYCTDRTDDVARGIRALKEKRHD